MPGHLLQMVPGAEPTPWLSWSKQRLCLHCNSICNSQNLSIIHMSFVKAQCLWGQWEENRKINWAQRIWFGVIAVLTLTLLFWISAQVALGNKRPNETRVLVVRSLRGLESWRWCQTSSLVSLLLTLYHIQSVWNKIDGCCIIQDRCIVSVYGQFNSAV